MTQAFPLSLHHLCALDVSAAELVDLAAANDCRLVSLFTNMPGIEGNFPTVYPADAPDPAARMADRGVTACNLEAFPLDGTTDMATFHTGLEVGARLGATKASAHVYDAVSLDEAAERFARMCELAAPYGITVGLEFYAFAWARDMETAASTVRGARQPNGSLVCDTLHFVRNECALESVARHADIIGYAQVNDGPASRPREEWWDEACATRELPGTGDFPIVEILRPLRRDTVIEVEVPREVDRIAGVSAADRIAAALAATREVLGRV